MRAGEPYPITPSEPGTSRSFTLETKDECDFTIQYNVFDTDDPDESDSNSDSDRSMFLDSRLTVCKTMLSSLTQIGRPMTLGFGLRHQYAEDGYSSSGKDQLVYKGHDKIIRQAVAEFELEFGLHIVWYMDRHDWNERDRYIFDNGLVGTRDDPNVDPSDV